MCKEFSGCKAAESLRRFQIVFSVASRDKESRKRLLGAANLGSFYLKCRKEGSYNPYMQVGAKDINSLESNRIGCFYDWQLTRKYWDVWNYVIPKVGSFIKRSPVDNGVVKVEQKLKSSQ